MSSSKWISKNETKNPLAVDVTISYSIKTKCSTLIPTEILTTYLSDNENHINFLTTAKQTIRFKKV